MTAEIQIVSNIYAAFGRGDVPGILEHIDGDVQWEYDVNEPVVPWLMPRRGVAGVTAFLQTVAEELAFERFEIQGVAGTGKLVLAALAVEATVKRTGKKLRDLGEAHIWHFGANGKVIKFRHAVDTHAHWRAYQP